MGLSLSCSLATMLDGKRLGCIAVFAFSGVAFGCSKRDAPSADRAGAAASASAAAVASGARPADELETPAGKLRIIDGGGFRQSLTLRAHTVYPPLCFDGGAMPNCEKFKEIAKAYERVRRVEEYRPTTSKELVVLFQVGTMGNACDGGPFFFVRFSPDGSYKLSDPIEYCGGPKPTIEKTEAAVTIRVPPSPPNRGTGIIPGEAHRYDLATGVVSKVK